VVAIVVVVVLCLGVIIGSGAFMWYFLSKEDQKVAPQEGPPIAGRAPMGVPPQVGQEAPEIEGEDIDGKQFKLSDYRGKVVLLDFWGHW
jgi:cytochrome oxidase Cu insertion factor (SCO1/SenC/PrrC family)